MMILLAALIVTNMAWILLVLYILKKVDSGVRQ